MMLTCARCGRKHPLSDDDVVAFFAERQRKDVEELAIIVDEEKARHGETIRDPLESANGAN